MQKAIATAPGKVILYGEHFVVYNVPAIVMAIDRLAKVEVRTRPERCIKIRSNLGYSCEYLDDGSVKVEAGDRSALEILEPIRIAAKSTLDKLDEKIGLSIDVYSDIPASVGLGSSAAVSVATVAAIGKLLGHEISKHDIWSLALEAERYVHVSPSGIDPLICTYGGMLIWSIEYGMNPKRLNTPIRLIVGNTGITRSTGKLVSMVSEKRSLKVEGISHLIGVMRWISDLAVKAMREKDMHTLGMLMNMNHELLKIIGVSHEALDRLVEATRKAGALGSKLTGGGGGGCMISLAAPSKMKSVMRAIESNGGAPMLVKKYESGVRAWIEKD